MRNWVAAINTVRPIMRKHNTLGTIKKGKESALSFDLGGHSFFWTQKPQELDRMVWLGVDASVDDAVAIKSYCDSNGQTAWPAKPTTLWVSAFLAALAIENLLKGHLVRKNRTVISQGKFHGHVITGHDLVLIAQHAGIALDADEADFCEYGTEAIKTFGRYHTGKNVSDSPSRIELRCEAFLIYRRLYDRLYSALLNHRIPRKPEQDGRENAG